jgi:DEAD/DEAH box helicase domain-containing protein
MLCDACTLPVRDVSAAIGPELSISGGILGNVPPKSQLILPDAALRQPSAVPEFLAELKKNSSVSGYHYIPACQPRFADLPESLAPSLRSVLRERGIERLYSHQAEAFRIAESGRNVAVVTPTASGKTLCYNLPVLQRIASNPDARALYLYPTKALTYDQLDDLMAWANSLDRDFGVYSYDGDTPQDARAAVRAKGHIVLTNPDMLHKGILPHHTKWARQFENLSFIIVDELHTYRGVFGSHVANVFRRLARVCEFYGSRPQFICTSATIANPKELAEHLTGAPFELIAESGAPAAEKHVFFYNPPVVNRQLGIRRSYVHEARQIAAAFLKRSIPAIVFANSRLITEILVRYLKAAFETGPVPQETVVGYRGGYLPNERRQIERGLRDGRIRGVVSTNALELGIDIGSLDVAVLAGYPGTIASTWQRMGRAGRRSGMAVAVMVASSAPLDQYIVNHPEYFLNQPPERGLVNPDNIHILISHLQCATFELPFGADEMFGGHPMGEILEFLGERGFIHRAGNKWHWTSDAYPADAVSLRSISSDNFVVVERDVRPAGEPRILGEVDYTSAFTTLHEKAIYLHQGQQYYVHELDIAERRAYVREVDSDYYTDAITYTKVKTLDTMETAAEHSHGEVHVAHQVVGFKKIKFFTMENVGSGDLNLPVQEMHTTAYWITLPRAQFEALPFASIDRLNGLHGLAHALAQLASVFLMCDRRDLGAAVEFGLENPTFHPTVYVYDNFPGGIGLSRPLYEIRGEVLAAAGQLIRSCGCEDGCPSCVGPTPRAKEVALAILDGLKHA